MVRDVLKMRYLLVLLPSCQWGWKCNKWLQSCTDGNRLAVRTTYVI